LILPTSTAFGDRARGDREGDTAAEPSSSSTRRRRLPRRPEHAPAGAIRRWSRRSRAASRVERLAALITRRTFSSLAIRFVCCGAGRPPTMTTSYRAVAARSRRRRPPSPPRRADEVGFGALRPDLELPPPRHEGVGRGEITDRPCSFRRAASSRRRRLPVPLTPTTR
jgi:hypothetical protein